MCIKHLEPSYSDIDRPPVDPELMIRMLIVGYCYGIRHERRLCEEVRLHLAYRWFFTPAGRDYLVVIREALDHIEPARSGCSSGRASTSSRSAPRWISPQNGWCIAWRASPLRIPVDLRVSATMQHVDFARRCRRSAPRWQLAGSRSNTTVRGVNQSGHRGGCSIGAIADTLSTIDGSSSPVSVAASPRRSAASCADAAPSNG